MRCWCAMRVTDNPDCLRPLGSKAIAIFITALRTTGSGGATRFSTRESESDHRRRDRDGRDDLAIGAWNRYRGSGWPVVYRAECLWDLSA